MAGFQLLLSDISREFAANKTGMGLLVAAQYVSIIVMPLVFGHAADRLGKQAVIIAGAAVFVIGCALAAGADSSGLFVTGIFLIGTGFSVTESVSAAMLSDLYSGDGARYINICQCLLSIGAVLSF